MSLFDFIGDAFYVVGSVIEDVMIDPITENPGKSVALVGVALAGVATGGVAYAAAPAIGAAASAAGLGVAGGTLSGAAASSAGLAALGGGSLAKGGLGMAGGKAVIAFTGSTLGAGVSSAGISTVSKIKS